MTQTQAVQSTSAQRTNSVSATVASVQAMPASAAANEHVKRLSDFIEKNREISSPKRITIQESAPITVTQDYGKCSKDLSGTVEKALINTSMFTQICTKLRKPMLVGVTLPNSFNRTGFCTEMKHSTRELYVSQSHAVTKSYVNPAPFV